MAEQATIGVRVVPVKDIPPARAGRLVQVATVEQVRAALNVGQVVVVVVYCDCCGVERRADYIGATREVRLATARAWLVENESWTCDPGDGDRCPDCQVGRIDV